MHTATVLWPFSIPKGSKVAWPFLKFLYPWYSNPLPGPACIWVLLVYKRGFPGGSEGKASVCNAGDLGLIPGSGRSPGEGNSNPLQYSCLENPMDGGAWRAPVHGGCRSRTHLAAKQQQSLIHTSPEIHSYLKAVSDPILSAILFMSCIFAL